MLYVIVVIYRAYIKMLCLCLFMYALCVFIHEYTCIKFLMCIFIVVFKHLKKILICIVNSKIFLIEYLLFFLVVTDNVF